MEGNRINAQTNVSPPQQQLLTDKQQTGGEIRDPV